MGTISWYLSQSIDYYCCSINRQKPTPGPCVTSWAMGFHSLNLVKCKKTKQNRHLISTGSNHQNLSSAHNEADPILEFYMRLHDVAG